MSHAIRGQDITYDVYLEPETKAIKELEVHLLPIKNRPVTWRVQGAVSLDEKHPGSFAELDAHNKIYSLTIEGHLLGVSRYILIQSYVCNLTFPDSRLVQAMRRKPTSSGFSLALMEPKPCVSVAATLTICPSW
jgi:hypothetical protein